MNEKQARAEGLQFTGCYQSKYKGDLNIVREEARRIRSLGFKAITVDGNGGKSVYAEPAYFAAKEAYRQWKSASGKVERTKVEIMELEIALEGLRSQLKNYEELAAQPSPKVVE